jgi:hypothetical protein
MFRYTGNDDPTAAEGFNGLRTKDNIKRENPHEHTRHTSNRINKIVFSSLTPFEQ